MRIFPFFVFLFSLNTTCAQGYIAYHNDCNSAAELIEQGNFEVAKHTLLRAIQRVDEPLAIDYFNLAKCYSQLDESDSTLHFLELSLELDMRTKDICAVHYLWFEPILGTDKWNQVLETDYRKKEQLTAKQLQLLAKMENLVELDQYYNKIQTDSISVYYPEDTLLYNAYSDSVDMNVRLIQSELDKIIKTAGWPGKKVTGRQTSDGLLLLHVSDEWFYKRSDQLIAEIDKGNLMPWEYADIADRKRHEHQLPVLYNGYFATKDEVTEEIKRNCETIGAPLGKTRTIRAYYRMQSY